MNWLGLGHSDLSSIEFNRAMNHNRFAKDIKEEIFGYKYHILTFVPSVRLVKQTMLQTSSCQIMFQKSAIVFGFGPYNETKTL